MRRGFIWLVAAMLLPQAAAAADLTVVVSGVRGKAGHVIGAVYASEATFLSPAAAYRFKVRAAGEVTYTIHGVPAGRYAVAVFHDANDNGKLDRNLLGAPTEGHGFSHGARAMGGPPKFDAAAFDISGRDQTVSVSLDY